MFEKVSHWLLDQVGYPASLKEYLKTNALVVSYPLKDSLSVDGKLISRWHEWRMTDYDNQSSLLRGYAKVHGEYRDITITVPELSMLDEQVIIDEWECDIRQVELLYASRGQLDRYLTLDDFALDRCKGYLDDDSPEKIAENLAHGEVRIMRPGSDDHFVFHGWDGRIGIANNGGSHHFATARYLAKSCGQPVTLCNRLEAHLLNVNPVMALLDKFALFSVSNDATVMCALRDHFRALQVTYFIGKLPYPHIDGRVLLFPRGESRSMAVAAVLQQAGIADLGLHLTMLLDKQSKYEASAVHWFRTPMMRK